MTDKLWRLEDPDAHATEIDGEVRHIDELLPPSLEETRLHNQTDIKSAVRKMLAVPYRTDPFRNAGSLVIHEEEDVLPPSVTVCIPLPWLHHSEYGLEAVQRVVNHLTSMGVDVTCEIKEPDG